MFSSKDNFRRRVLVSHRRAGLVVLIARHNYRTSYIIMLSGLTAIFMFFGSLFVPPLFRHPVTHDVAYLLPVIAFVASSYVVQLRFGVWRAFGVEEIEIKAGVLIWTRTALWWVRKIELPTADIADVKAIRPWHSLNNHVELIARNRRYNIGDMLLQDETTELAHQLRHAVGLGR